MRQSLSRNMRLARATAPPDITMLRDAKVPKPNAVLSVSPCRTEIRAGSIPFATATEVSVWPLEITAIGKIVVRTIPELNTQFVDKLRARAEEFATVTSEIQAKFSQLGSEIAAKAVPARKAA